MPGANVYDVEFGVGVAAPFSAAGNVVYSVTPSGNVATTTRWGRRPRRCARGRQVPTTLRDARPGGRAVENRARYAAGLMSTR